MASIDRPNSRNLSRREFFLRLGSAGGYGAAYLGLQALGLMPVSAQAASTPQLTPGSGRGKKIVILGAGIAGLISAYELGKAGYDCVVLEARDRVGGRNWSVRRGTRIEMDDGSSQTCDFDEGLYFNAGPARLPSNHQTILGYCHELGVPLEVEVNMSRSALLQDDDANRGKPIEMRQAVYDTRGRVAELLAKCADSKALDAELSGIDRERFHDFLKAYGDLDDHLKYAGSERAGYKIEPAAGSQVGVRRDPLSLETLLNPVFWNGPDFDDNIDMQATMFQPVGGMDRIPYAFYARLKSVVQLGTEVREIRNNAHGVSISYRERQGGANKTVDADYCICTIPPPVLKSIPANFSPEFAKGIAEVTYGHSNKIAWQAPRFWETDRHIYGGLTFVNRDVTLIWYPSGGFFQPQGILIGCYNFEEQAARFMQQPIPKRLQDSRDALEALFPGRSRDLTRGITVAWNKVPYNLGPWTNWKEPAGALYKLLDQPDGRIYLAGEHMSHINGWQEGAAVSAHGVLKMIAERTSAAV